MSASENTKVTIQWTDYRDVKHTREINQVIDVRDFLGTPGYSLLLVAANTDLSISDIELFLRFRAHEYPSVKRSPSWIQRRRWLFRQPGQTTQLSDRDGNQARAFKIMSEHPNLSIRDLQELLKENGIKRSREWVRINRCKGVRH